MRSHVAAALSPLSSGTLLAAPSLSCHAGSKDTPTKGGRGDSEGRGGSCHVFIRLTRGTDGKQCCVMPRWHINNSSGSSRAKPLLSEHDVTSPSETLNTGALGVLLRTRIASGYWMHMKISLENQQNLIPLGPYPHPRILVQRTPQRLWPI